MDLARAGGGAVGARAAAVSVVVIAAAAGARQLLSARDAAAAAPAVNMNCTLIVPANPLTARGLATPYQLTATNSADGPCDEANANQTAFVQGAVLDPRTGRISVYDPLVVDQGAQPAAAPVVPALPAGAIVAVWFGFNGGTLSLAGAAPAASATPDAILQQASCVAGENTGGQFSSFTQVGACNAVAFFRAANAAIRAGRLRVPAPGGATDGMQCPTTRSFALIDQDQSDNVTTEYLAASDGQVAQDTAANRQALGGAATLFNGSDNGLLDLFVDPALGCKPWEEPDLADGGTPARTRPTRTARWWTCRRCRPDSHPASTARTWSGSRARGCSRT